MTQQINKPFNENNIEKFVEKYSTYDDLRIVNLILSKIRLQSKLKNRNDRHVRLYSTNDHDKQVRCGENKCTCIKVREDVLSFFPFFNDLNECEVELEFSSSVLLLFSEWLNIGFDVLIQNQSILKDNSYDPIEMLFFLDFIEAPDIFHSVFLSMVMDKLLKKEKHELLRFIHQYQQYINEVYKQNGNSNLKDLNLT